MSEPRHIHTVAVIGAGPGGIAAAVKLKQRGIDFLLIDRNHEGVGGTWLQNNYPGLGIDVPGIAYQFGFARNPAWTRTFPMRDEVLQYHVDVAKRYGVTEHGRFGVVIAKERWNEDQGYWELTSEEGEVFLARFVISAVGFAIVYKTDPGIPGWQDFKGKLLRPMGWDWSYDLAGKRVAVIGTGASSVQITPTIAPQVAHLDVYQRTPNWVLPKPDFRIPVLAQKLLALPGVGAVVDWAMMAASQLGHVALIATPTGVFRPAAKAMMAVTGALYRAYVRRAVKDGETAKKLIPQYGIAYKRPTLSNEFLQAFNRDNVELITTEIERITETGVRTIDGVEHPVDALVLATGFELFSDPESYREGAVVGRDGFDQGSFFNETLLQAYEGVMVPKVPNRWIVIGPYSWIAPGWHHMVDVSTEFAVNGIVETLGRGAKSIEVTSAATERFMATIQRNYRNIQIYFRELNSGRSYYVNSQGVVHYARPTTVFAHRKSSRNLKLKDYMFRGETEPHTERASSQLAARPA